MKGKALIPLVLGLVIGLLAVKFVVDTVRKAQASNKPAASIAAVRAKQDIAAHIEITPDLVEIVHTADEQFAPKTERFEKLEDVLTRVSAKPIPAKAPVLASMLAPPNTRPGMVGRIPPGHRAQSVKISEETAVGYQLRAGNMVDVIAIMDIDMGGRKKEKVSEVILENVQVAAVGQMQQGDQAEKAGGKVKPARSATLMVPVSEGPLLHWANTLGEITLTMRGDEERREEGGSKGGVILAAFQRAQGLDLHPQQVAAPPPQSASEQPVKLVSAPLPHEVVLVRGGGRGSVERITFESEDSARVINSSTSGDARGPIGRMSRTPRQLPAATATTPASTEPTQPAEGKADMSDEDFDADGQPKTNGE